MVKYLMLYILLHTILNKCHSLDKVSIEFKPYQFIANLKMYPCMNNISIINILNKKLKHQSMPLLKPLTTQWTMLKAILQHFGNFTLDITSEHFAEYMGPYCNFNYWYFNSSKANKSIF